MSGGKMMTLPPEVGEVFREFRTCEFSTTTRDGAPVAWPLIPLWRPEEGRFVFTTSIGLPRKAFNIRRDPRVSLLFSDPTASGLESPPAVLVQGDAEITEEIKTSPAGFEDYWERLFRVQPAGRCTARTSSCAASSTGTTCGYTSSSGPAASCGGRRATSRERPRSSTMWDEIEKYLPMFESVVLNAADETGYPYSVRCHPKQDRSAGVLRLDLAEGDARRSGPASLLCHSHDANTWNQKIFVLREDLKRPETDGRSGPRSSSPA